jgi:hypothetical protein
MRPALGVLAHAVYEAETHAIFLVAWAVKWSME